jgi:hypothetical protein
MIQPFRDQSITPTSIHNFFFTVTTSSRWIRQGKSDEQTCALILEQPEPPENVQDEKPTIPFQMEEVANYKMGTKIRKRHIPSYQPRKISYPEIMVKALEQHKREA